MISRLKWSFALLAVLGLGVSQARAGIEVLTFEGLQNNESVNNFYNGGTGSLGSGPGPNYGITFSSNSKAFISDQDGGSLHSDAGALPSSDTGMLFLSGAAATMNVAGGFTSGLSFFYSAIHNPGEVKVYDGLNATGNLLATLDLAVTPAEPSGRFQPFFAAGVSFAGTAMSVDFVGTENQIVFDNVTLGTANPVVPEPSALVLGAIGLVGLVGYTRRRQARAA